MISNFRARAGQSAIQESSCNHAPHAASVVRSDF